MRLKLICCEIYFREICHLVAESANTIDLEFTPKGLHDLGSEKMVARLQGCVDAVPADGYDAVLMGYALCNNGVAELKARHVPVVVPRAHDCIAVFMGSRERYKEYFDAHPATYYRTTGWFERADGSGAGDTTVPQQLGLFQGYDQLVAEYGEDNARYIMETMGDPMAHYDRLTYISVGLACEASFRQRAEEEAQERGWAFDHVEGSLDLLRKFVNGQWDDDFLVVPPGHRIVPSHDDDVIKVAPCDAPNPEPSCR